jgi:hypothetical protein
MTAVVPSHGSASVRPSSRSNERRSPECSMPTGNCSRPAATKGPEPRGPLASSRESHQTGERQEHFCRRRIEKLPHAIPARAMA